MCPQLDGMRYDTSFLSLPLPNLQSQANPVEKVLLMDCLPMSDKLPFTDA